MRNFPYNLIPKSYSLDKVRFKVAAHVFLDENRLDNYDEIHSDFEDRIKTIGMVGEILTVIFTERGEKYRLISARKANRKERNDYYGQYYY